MSDFQTVDTAGSEESDSAPLFVALFIVLLAFFILLNSISNIDDKKHRRAMNSILATFDMPLQMDTDKPRPSDSLELIAQPLLAALKEATASIINVDEELPELDGNVIRINMNAEDLFELDESIIRADRGYFLQKVFSGLAAPLPGVEVTSEILIGINTLQDDNTELSVRRAGVLARLFASSGISTTHMNVGLVPRDVKNVAFVFYLTPQHGRRD